MQLLYLLVYFIPLIWAVPALMEVIGYVRILKSAGKIPAKQGGTAESIISEAARTPRYS